MGIEPPVAPGTHPSWKAVRWQRWSPSRQRACFHLLTKSWSVHACPWSSSACFLAWPPPSCSWSSLEDPSHGLGNRAPACWARGTTATGCP